MAIWFFGTCSPPLHQSSLHKVLRIFAHQSHQSAGTCPLIPQHVPEGLRTPITFPATICCPASLACNWSSDISPCANQITRRTPSGMEAKPSVCLCGVRSTVRWGCLSKSSPAFIPMEPICHIGLSCMYVYCTVVVPQLVFIIFLFGTPMLSVIACG